MCSSRDFSLLAPPRSSELNQRFLFEYELGLWTYGSTCVVKDRWSGELLTCKALSKAALGGRCVEAKLRRLQELRHPHISSLVDLLEDPQHYFLLFAHTAGGDLGDWLDRLGEQHWLQEEICATYVSQVLVALAFCHQQGVHHRDLRPCSILLTSKLPDAAALLSDCGLAEVLDPDGAMARGQPCPYLAPELRKESGRFSGGTVDVWSVGAVACALLAGSGSALEEEDWCTQALLSGRSAAARDFVRQALGRAGDRPSAACLLQHPWLRGVVVPRLVDGRARHDAQEVRQRLVCYMLGVLLAPSLLSAADMSQLQQAFQRADVDFDGMLPEQVARRLFCEQREAQEADLAAALAAVDVRSIGQVDLCSALCAAALAELAGGVGAIPASAEATHSGASQTQELSTRATQTFFRLHGMGEKTIGCDWQQHLLESPAAQLMEDHAGVDYEKLFEALPQGCETSRQTLLSALSASGARGTPLAADSCCPLEQQEEGCWSLGGADWGGALLRGLGAGCHPRDCRPCGSKHAPLRLPRTARVCL